MDVTINFDEHPLVKALVDQVVQAVEDEFHKIFPRLRREDMDNIHLTGATLPTASSPAKNVAKIEKVGDPLVYYNLSMSKIPAGFYYVAQKEDESSTTFQHYEIEFPE